VSACKSWWQSAIIQWWWAGRLTWATIDGPGRGYILRLYVLWSRRKHGMTTLMFSNQVIYRDIPVDERLSVSEMRKWEVSAEGIVCLSGEKHIWYTEVALAEACKLFWWRTLCLPQRISLHLYCAEKSIQPWSYYYFIGMAVLQWADDMEAKYDWLQCRRIPEK